MSPIVLVQRSWLCSSGRFRFRRRASDDPLAGLDAAHRGRTRAVARTGLGGRHRQGRSGRVPARLRHQASGPQRSRRCAHRVHARVDEQGVHRDGAGAAGRGRQAAVGRSGREAHPGVPRRRSVRHARSDDPRSARPSHRHRADGHPVGARFRHAHQPGTPAVREAGFEPALDLGVQQRHVQRRGRGRRARLGRDLPGVRHAAASSRRSA